MKKLIAVVLTCIMVIGLCACGGGPAKTYTLEEYYAANELLTVLSAKNQVKIVQTTYDEEDKVTNNFSTQYIYNNGNICQNYELKTEYWAETISYYKDDEGGAFYMITDGELYMEGMTTEDYERDVRTNWYIIDDGSVEETITAQTTDKSGNPVLTIEGKYVDFANYVWTSEVTLDKATGIVIKKVDTYKDSEGNFNYKVVNEIDTESAPEAALAYDSIHTEEDPCKLTLCFIQADGTEYENKFSIKKNVEVQFYSSKLIGMYSDHACTNKVGMIATDQPENTVYILLGAEAAE